jgi:ubiquinone/menaquinone biosynthesis C-methylase UbiE
VDAGPWSLASRGTVYVSGLKDYYENLWSRLPVGLTLPDLERRRRFLVSELRPEDRVLDLGCGEGTFAAYAIEAGTAAVLAADVAEAALVRAASAHPQLDLRLVPFCGPLPFEDCSFDLVWASEVIEHVADTAAWLSEVRRVLAPRGRLLLTTPSHGRLRLLAGGIERYSEPLGDHLHLYTARSLRGLLSEFGFDPVMVIAAGPPLARRLLLARGTR